MDKRLPQSKLHRAKEMLQRSCKRPGTEHDANILCSQQCQAVRCLLQDMKTSNKRTVQACNKAAYSVQQYTPVWHSLLLSIQSQLQCQGFEGMVSRQATFTCYTRKTEAGLEPGRLPSLESLYIKILCLQPFKVRVDPWNPKFLMQVIWSLSFTNHVKICTRFKYLLWVHLSCLRNIPVFPEAPEGMGEIWEICIP